jgi:glutamate/tyrosine decarboxylase-like PLP-dependent enzyme
MLIDELQSQFAKLQHDIRNGPIYPTVTAPEIRSHLGKYYDFARPQQLEDVVADVTEMLRNWDVQITHPRYFGLFNPSVTLASVAADVLVAMHNPQLASWRTSPAGNEIERHTLMWLAGKFGLPDTTLATFTSGGAEANLSAVIVALTRAFPRYGENGLRSIDCTPTIYLSSQAHDSFTKIAHMTGLGRNSVRIVATDRQLKMDVADLQRQIAEDRRRGFFPLMVVGTCGSTTAGVIDPLAELGAFCADNGLWFHVDAAWGGAAILSPILREYLAGIESADSITCDGHKWFSVPMACGMFFCRHPESAASAFHAKATYMPNQAGAETFDPYTHSVQWSRRFTGLKLFMSFAQHGASGYAHIIDRQTRMGDLLRKSLSSSGWKILNPTPLPLVCFTREGLDIPSFLASMREHQIAWVSEGEIEGTPVVRACITSYKTTERDVQWVVDQMNRLVTNQVADCAAAAAVR